MKSDALFPFGIRAGYDSAGADTLTVLTAGIHLDRRNARAIGWRGLRPCMGTGYAWTMRLAGKEGVYGLAFLDEERSGGVLRARFSAFYFPDPEEKALLAAYSFAARHMAAEDDYFGRIREFTRWEGAGQFFLGLFRLDVRLDLHGVAFSVEAPARQRAVALDGVPHDGVEPGGLAHDVPALHLAIPLLRLLALSASSLIESVPEWFVSRTAYPAAAFTAEGEWGTLQDETHPGAILLARFGASVPGVFRDACAVRKISGKGFALKEPEFEDSRPVLHVVSGFLGSGKTTFLAEWLAWLHNHDRHTAVLQNELGAKSLDSSLLRHETVSETLDEGCVCCTLGDSLRPAIRRLTETLPTEQIVLETTGVANPGAVADALDELLDTVRPGLCVSLVDAFEADRLFAEFPAGPCGLAGEQIRRANVLVCNKTDMIPPERIDLLMRGLKAMNPDAVVFPAVHGRIPFGELDRLFEKLCRPGARAGAALRLRPARHITHRDEGYGTLLFEVTRPVSAEELAAIVRFAQDKTPRIKGVVDSAEEGGPRIVQYAAERLSLEVPFSAPGPERFLVFIGRELDAPFASSLSRFPGLRYAG